ncbi:CHASE2 domain-containing protein [Pseudorhodoferax sp. Leaf274]|uniref:CHASE2 domain-containing protein n=1 Tax=Pseudorhodoferax sp. Leaf274 TaxID=1736318 RepID=UPI0007027EEB|nr:CHASE2 domain-containing protein [Pseudorhodoferax sp. Leaf274]KQP37307.1 hypothetical protein ASF44_13125 [Pseudorhodoferax sp. Leaf274]
MLQLNRTRLRWNLWVAAVTVVIGVGFGWVLGSILPTGSMQRAAARVLLPFLPYPEKAAEDITVITVAERDLQSFFVDLPLPADFLANRIDAIVSLKPRALFLDFAFLNNRRREDIQPFIDAVCRAAQQDVRVFVAFTGKIRSRVEQALLNSSVLRPHSSGGPGTAGKSCVTFVHAHITPDNVDQLQWRYPVLLGPNVPDLQTSKPGSAAASIYCHLQPHRCSEKQSRPMAVIWPASGHESNERIMRRAAEVGTVSLCRADLGWASVPGVSLVYKPQLCPFHRVVPLRSFNGEFFNEEELGKAIKGRIVMVGEDSALGSDHVLSPVHGRLPGVHAHAMALDNLLAFDGRYRQVADGFLDVGGNLFVYLSVVTLTAYFGVRRYVLRQANPPDLPHTGAAAARPPTTGHLLFFAALPVLVGTGWRRRNAPTTSRPRSSVALSTRLKLDGSGALLALALFVVGYYGFRQGPLSIVDYVLFPFLASFLQIGERVAVRGHEWWYALFTASPWRTWSDDARSPPAKPRRSRTPVR